MAFYYLLLGHLLGDFVLQTDKIAEKKGKYWQWNLLHVAVIILCTFMLSYQYGLISLVMVLINGLLHFALDYSKPYISRMWRIPELPGFLSDQLMHILLLYVVSLLAVHGGQHLIDFTIVRQLILLVIITSFSAVLTQFILAALFPRNGRFFEEREKYTGILARIFMAFVIYMALVKSPLFLLLFTLPAAVFFLQFKSKWSGWMSPPHLASKLLLDTAVSAVCVFLFLYI